MTTTTTAPRPAHRFDPYQEDPTLRAAEVAVDAAAASGDADATAAAARALIVAAAAYGWPTATALVFTYETTGPIAHVWGLWKVLDADRQRALDDRVAYPPAHAGRQRIVLARDAVAVGLRPDVRLAVGDPGAAHVEVESGERAALDPEAAADPVARLDHGDLAAGRLEVAGGDETRQPRPDDDHVEHAPRKYRGPGRAVASIA